MEDLIFESISQGEHSSHKIIEHVCTRHDDHCTKKMVNQRLEMLVRSERLVRLVYGQRTYYYTPIGMEWFLYTDENQDSVDQ